MSLLMDVRRLPYVIKSCPCCGNPEINEKNGGICDDCWPTVSAMGPVASLTLTSGDEVISLYPDTGPVKSLLSNFRKHNCPENSYPIARLMLEKLRTPELSGLMNGIDFVTCTPVSLTYAIRNHYFPSLLISRLIAYAYALPCFSLVTNKKDAIATGEKTFTRVRDNMRLSARVNNYYLKDKKVLVVTDRVSCGHTVAATMDVLTEEGHAAKAVGLSFSYVCTVGECNG